MSVDQVSDFEIRQISHKTIQKFSEFKKGKKIPETTAVPILPPFIVYKNDLLNLVLLL